MTRNDTRDAALAKVVGEIEKQHGKGSIMRLDSKASSEPIAVVPSGSLALDEALGVGGYPRGRIVEIFGPESSGKTTLTLHAIAEVQKRGGVAAFIDAEHAFDMRYAKALGVQLENLLVAQPDCGEQALGIAELLIATGNVDLIVIDSVAALVPKSEIEGDMGAPQMGGQARLMSQALRKITNRLSKTSTTLILINQLRMKIGVVFGNPETTPGGVSIRYYSSVRLDVRRIGKVEAGDQVVGNRTRVRVVKNKVSPPFRDAEMDIRWGVGIDRAGELLELAMQHGLVQRNGAHFSLDGKAIGQGRERARDALLSEPKLMTALEAAVVAQLPSKTPPQLAKGERAVPEANEKPRKAA